MSGDPWWGEKRFWETNKLQFNGLSGDSNLIHCAGGWHRIWFDFLEFGLNLLVLDFSFSAFGFNLLVLDSPRVGRRLALSGCMLLAGVVLVLSPLIPPDQVLYHDDNDNDENEHEDLPWLSFTSLFFM